MAIIGIETKKLSNLGNVGLAMYGGPCILVQGEDDVMEDKTVLLTLEGTECRVIGMFNRDEKSIEAAVAEYIKSLNVEESE